MEGFFTVQFKCTTIKHTQDNGMAKKAAYPKTATGAGQSLSNTGYRL